MRNPSTAANAFAVLDRALDDAVRNMSLHPSSENQRLLELARGAHADAALLLSDDDVAFIESQYG